MALHSFEQIDLAAQLISRNYTFIQRQIIKKPIFAALIKTSAMAKKKNTEGETIVDVQKVYSKTEQYVEDNSKVILIIGAIIVVLFAGYFAVTRLYMFPKNEEGMELLWKAEYWFEIDSLQKALDGNESYYGFEHVANEYSSTQAGELAAYYSGIIYLQMGDYERAISYLEQADLSDHMLGAVSLGATGDAYVELGNLGKALGYFDKAISHSDNPLTAPVYLKKAALVHEDLGQSEEALENYQKIKEQYPTSNEARNIESYIARVGG
jgi:tetratricopeptide (TPR) repeat protein